MDGEGAISQPRKQVLVGTVVSCGEYEIERPLLGLDDTVRPALIESVLPDFDYFRYKSR